MSDVLQLIADTANKYGVDPALAIEVANAESALNPDTPDSSAGAIGLFQLEPATAAQLGVDPRDPVQNVDGGVRYLRQMLSQFPDVAAALGAYDWGPGNMAKAIAQWGPAWLAHAPAETQNYVARILGGLQEYTVQAPLLTEQPPTAAPSSSSASFSASVGPGGDASVPVSSGPSLTTILVWAAIGVAGLLLIEEVT